MKKTLLLLSLLLFSGLVFAQNNALNFDGTDDYVITPDLYSDFNGTSRTIELWFYAEAPGIIIAEQGTITLDQNWFDAQIEIKNDNSVNVAVWGNPGGIMYQVSVGTVSLNSWNHVALRYNVSTGLLDGFLNGNASGTNSVSILMPGTGNLYYTIGAYTATNMGSDAWFNGKVDEVRFWNDVRTEDEIRQNMYRELPNPSAESNLVAYYKANQTSGTTLTDSKGSNNGTLTNMAGTEWETSPAMFGPKNSIEFDGDDDYVTISGLDPDGFGAITVETWVYFDAFNGSEDANISNVIRSGNENVCLRIGDGGMDPNMPQFVVTVSGQTKLNANARLSTGVWYHIAGVYDGLEMKLYINGVLDNSRVLTGSIASTSEVFALGSTPATGAGNREMDGRMDEVRIWSDARTQAEIIENMGRSLTGNEAGLLAYYNGDDLSTEAIDYSGNGYDGTLVGDVSATSSTAFNTWLNTSSSGWSTAANWSRGSAPASSDNIGVYSYSGGSNAAVSGSPTVNDLILGSGSSLTLSSGITVNGNLLLESNLNLNGQTITLGSEGYLVEDGGRLYGSTGSITTTRSLSNIDENVGGLGAEITTSANMGSTTISRTHVANADPLSIQRRYAITPTNNSGLSATLVFHYNENELNGLSESALELYRSTDGGSNWVDQNGSVNTFVNTITLTGIGSFSDWTAMEEEGVTPPILESQNPSQDYYSGSTAVVIAQNLTVTTSSTIENATVSISPIVSEDVLSVSNLPTGLNSSWDNTTKILSISGSGSASDYQTALRNVKFETTATAEASRTIDFILGDGVGLVIDDKQHFYEVIDHGSNISWSNARAAALASRFGEAQGYLATITSQTENEYLSGKVSADTWIGASDSEVEGVWRWIDGPEAGTQFWLGDLNAGTSSTTNYGSAVNGEYANWYTNEPNNAYSSYGEDCAHMYGGGNAGYWNDYYDGYNVQYYIIEYGGDGSTFTTIDDATIEVKTELSWDGSSGTDWATAGNWAGDVVPEAYHNVIIPNIGNQPVIASTTQAEVNNLTIESGASLTIQSDASNNGSLIVNGSSSGSVTYNRWMTAGQWHLIASPVGGLSVAGFIGTNSDDIATKPTDATFYGLALYNNATAGWNHYTTEYMPGSLTAGKGYEILRTGVNGSFEFTGSIRTSDQTIGITAYSSPGNAWNLVGNPFTSALNANAAADAANNFITVNTAELDASYQAIYVWDADAGSYTTINQTGAAYVAPGQAFFVYSQAGGGTVSFTEAMQTHQTGDLFTKGASASDPEIELFAVCSKGNSSTHIQYMDKMTTGLDAGYDAGRFSGADNSFAVFTHLVGDRENEVDFDIQCLPSNAFEHVVPVGLYAPANTEVVFHVETENLPADVPVYLEDRDAGIFTPLDESGSFYAVSFTDESTGIGRFYLHMQYSTTDILLPEQESAFSLIPQPKLNKIRILGETEEQVEVAVYDLYGRMLLKERFTNSDIHELDMQNLKNGIYIVKIQSASQQSSQKISWVRN